MASATLNILGLYNWTTDHDEPSIFRDLVVPEEIDQEVLEANILMRAAPF